MQDEPPKHKSSELEPSQPKIGWRKPIILLLIVTAFGFYAVLTGGMVVSKADDFGGQRNVALVRGLDSDLWLAPELRRFDFPLAFHYHSARKPFGLRLQIWDRSKQYQTIDIGEIVIEYEDGEVIRRTDPWVRQLRPYTAYHSSSSGASQTEMFMLSDQISDLVLRHLSVKITLTGQLIKVDGERVPFKTSETFKARSSTQISTYWQEVASC